MKIRDFTRNPLRVFAAMLLVCVVGLSTSVARSASAFTLEQVRSYAFPDSLVAARKGAQVAWVVNDRGRRNVWVANGPEFKARQLTQYTEDDAQEISSLSLTEDGSQVVYVRGGEHGGNWDLSLPVNALSDPAGTKVEIWSVSFAGGTPRRLGEGDYPVVSREGRVAFVKEGAIWVAPVDGSAEARKLFTARGTAGSPSWSPDGSRLAFVSSREATSYIGIYSDDSTPILWLAPSANRDSAPRWSPDSRRIAFVRRAGDGGAPPPALEFDARRWAIWIANARTGAAEALWESGPTLRDTLFPGFMEWGAQGRVVFSSYQDGWQHLYSLSERGGKPLLLTPGDYMVEDATLIADRSVVIFSANTGADRHDVDRRHLYAVPVDEAKTRALTSGAGIEWGPVVNGANQLVLMSSTAQRPPLPATLPINGGNLRLLAPELLPADFPVKELVIPSKVTFQAADGVTVHGQLFMPRRAAKSKQPAVVYIHGGPQRQMLLGWHMRAYYSNDYAVNQYLAQRGFVVLAVNYRLGPGYGHDYHFPKAAGQRGGAEYQDIKAAGLYLQSLPQVDANRIGLYGGSYGGYLTAMGLAHDSALFKVGVDIHGVHDWVLAFGLKDLLARTRYEAPVDAQRALDVGWQSSPVSAMATWKSPVLFITGDDDRNVRAGQTVDMVRRLQGTGVYQESLILVDETHSIHRHSNMLKMNAATVEFLERYLRNSE